MPAYGIADEFSKFKETLALGLGLTNALAAANIENNYFGANQGNASADLVAGNYGNIRGHASANLVGVMKGVAKIALGLDILDAKFDMDKNGYNLPRAGAIAVDNSTTGGLGALAAYGAVTLAGVTAGWAIAIGAGVAFVGSIVADQLGYRDELEKLIGGLGGTDTSPEDTKTLDDYLKEAIRRDAETDPYSHEEFADAAARLYDARENGNSPKQIADAIRSGVPGALSFLASGRPLVDNPYGPNGTPQTGGVDPGQLAASVLRATVNVPGYQPFNPPDPFQDRGGPTGPNSFPPNSNGFDGAGSAGKVPSHLDGPKASSGGSGTGGKSDSGKNSGWSNGTEPRDAGGGSKPSSKPGTASANKFNAKEAAEKGKSGYQQKAEPPRDDRQPTKSQPEHKSKKEHDKHLQEKNYDRSKPVLLDLDGNGIAVTGVDRSSVYMDAGGNGLLHRTAWAAAGDGVLFFDPDGRNAITEKRQYVFTEWDPTAKGDLEAIRSRFDTNGDGQLTAADADFAKFKVMVTNADGSTTARTLAELGITSINLSPDATHIVLPDGSVITGQTTFTKSDGSTATVANTTLTTEADGHRVVQVASTDADGTRTIDT